jgi:hypothetical protein
MVVAVLKHLSNEHVKIHQVYGPGISLFDSRKCKKYFDTNIFTLKTTLKKELL